LERKGFTRETRPLTPCAKIWAKALACLAGALIIFLTFIPAADFGHNKSSWSPAWMAVYITFSRPLWAACWAVITLLCYYDYLPVINGFLAHPSWAPLARLTYGAYLVHPMAVELACGRALQFYTFQSLDLIYRWCGNCVFAFLGSLVLWFLVERPCMTIFSPGAARTQKAPSNVKAPSSVLVSVQNMKPVDPSQDLENPR